MPETPVKICGLSRPDSVDAAIAGGARYLGFIFFEKSPRNVSPHEAGKLVKKAAGRAICVAVTVNADNNRLDGIVAGMQPDLLQLHGTESAERVLEVKLRYGLPVMKALSIRDSGDFGTIANYSGVANRILLDARPPADGQLPGGNGVAFDWRMLEELEKDINFMLSGGINLDNLADALRYARSGGIDVSSGVESRPGVKDNALIGEFLARTGELEKMPAS
jgi:phosphoribosylanthranilate isomerase